MPYKRGFSVLHRRAVWWQPGRRVCGVAELHKKVVAAREVALVTSVNRPRALGGGGVGRAETREVVGLEEVVAMRERDVLVAPPEAEMGHRHRSCICQMLIGAPMSTKTSAEKGKHLGMRADCILFPFISSRTDRRG